MFQLRTTAISDKVSVIGSRLRRTARNDDYQRLALQRSFMTAPHKQFSTALRI
jgi:hypothetical protein